MIDTLFIAEKPSLAEAIAQARAEQLGVKAYKANGCWTVGNDNVVWFFGHMYEQPSPEHYDLKWVNRGLETLPVIIPDEKWCVLPCLDKKPHLAEITKRCRDAKTIVCAGDAAREGQLLIDEHLLSIKINPFGNNIKRLWVQSVVRKDMIAALNSIKPNSTYKPLYEAAVLRQRLDWLVGMNYSRLQTGLAKRSGNFVNFVVGRVQTPTLWLVATRDNERTNFRPVDHYTVTAACAPGGFKSTWAIPETSQGLDSEGRLIDKLVADTLVRKVVGRNGKVTAFKSDIRTKAAPLPFSLATLQAECSSKLGLSAADTLKVAQELYEKYKATTYPRSDSRYLPKALHAECPGIIQALSETNEFADISKNADANLKSHAFDDSKVSDHHGIIPTTEFRASKLSEMNANEKAVFLIIAKPFLAQFYPEHKFRALTCELSVEGELFRANGKQIIEQGWKKVYGTDVIEDEDEEPVQTLPVLTVGDTILIQDASTNAQRTKAPAAFTDGTLITAMANIHRFVTNPEHKKTLRESDGIGTSATRDATIEKLLKLNYLERKGKVGLQSTELGRSIVANCPQTMTDPGTTALWERQLSEIAAGKLDASVFMGAQTREILAQIDAGLASTTRMSISGAPAAKPRAGVVALPGDGATCPKCGVGVMKTTPTKDGRTFLGCTNWSACNKLTTAAKPDVAKLEGHGGTCPKCQKGTLVSRVDKSGKPFLGCSNWQECSKTSSKPASTSKIAPIEGHGKACPNCKSGKMLTKEIALKDGSKTTALSCNQYPACKTTEWQKTAKRSA